MVRALLEVIAILVTIAAGMATLYHIYHNWWRRSHRKVRVVRGSDEDRQWAAEQFRKIREEKH